MVSFFLHFSPRLFLQGARGSLLLLTHISLAGAGIFRWESLPTFLFMGSDRAIGVQTRGNLVVVDWGISKRQGGESGDEEETSVVNSQADVGQRKDDRTKEKRHDGDESKREMRGDMSESFFFFCLCSLLRESGGVGGRHVRT